MKELVISLVLLCPMLMKGQTLKMDHIALVVNHLDSSAMFYQEVLGLVEIEDKTQMDHIRWFDMGNGTSLHLIWAQAFDMNPKIETHFALRVEDLDAFIVILRDKDIFFKNWLGVPYTTNTRPDGVRQIYLQDPNGYWIEVNSSK